MIKPKIEKNVPIPDKIGAGRPSKYRWNEMAVGDSFLFPKGIGRSAHNIAAFASKEGKLFKVYKTEEGYRCWRIE